MRNVAFGFALLVLAVGLAGAVVPASLVWLAGRFATRGAFYVLGAVRIAFGALLIAVAPSSRAPRGLRVLGVVIVALGLAAAIAGFAALGEARDVITAWQRADPALLRLTSLIPLAIGGFAAWACAPRGATR